MLESIYWPVRRRFLPLLWRNSLWAYRQYQRHPRPIWLRRVYDELIVRDDVWSGDTELPGLSSVKVFDSAAAAGDTASAEKAGRAMIDGYRDPLQCGTARLVLAARALLVHDNLALADRLIMENRQGENPLGGQIERVLLTLGQERAVDSNRQLIGALVENRSVPIGSLMKAWMRSRWLYEGPSQELLRDLLPLAEKAGRQQASMLRDVLALAFLLNDMSMVKKLLSSCPELETSYDCILPFAAHLNSSGVSSALSSDRARVSEFAELCEQLNDGVASLMESLRDKTRTIALVGNSPCELGSGRGPLIDGHDMVARFNLFSTTDEFVSDYGRKCSIHVRHPEHEHVNQCSLASGWVVLNRPDLIYRQRRWENVLTLSRAGARLSALPAGFHQPLYKKLKAEPSGGITFCALVKTVRERLPRASCFGFSFVDQIGKEATSAHYFRDARPSFKHRWTREKAMFEELTERDERSVADLS